ncbi:MAG: GNAT family N-acetyltransferase [Bdellovibrionales bacterium]|nr:GNAT family N-acetyltransferase [Bdellovibrionales bacterium]
MSATVLAKSLFRSFQEARQKKSLLQQVREYRGFVHIHYETDQFIVETARTSHQLLKVLELRHEIFVEEWQGRRAYHGLDVDQYDFMADHLLIIDKSLAEVVGTYRLLSSHFTNRFYSASEFDLTEFLRIPAVKLELGRACVHPTYRNGQAIELLWKGLSRYIAKTKTEYLFGCSSVKSTSADVVGQIIHLMHADGQWSDEFEIRPTEDYHFPGFPRAAGEPMTTAQRKALLPPLLRSYLHAGAQVYGFPALDRDFECTDMLTILDWNRLNPRFKSRFSEV